MSWRKASQDVPLPTTSLGTGPDCTAQLGVAATSDIVRAAPPGPTPAEPGGKVLEIWDAQAVHPPAASQVSYVATDTDQARGQSSLEAPNGCPLQNPASVQQHRAFKAPRPDAQSRWNKHVQRPEAHKTVQLATSATGGTRALRFPQAHEPAMLRHRIVPDTFGNLEEYKMLWTSALVEELNLR